MNRRMFLQASLLKYNTENWLALANIHSLQLIHTFVWSLSQLPEGERRDTPWTGCQFYHVMLFMGP